MKPICLACSSPLQNAPFSLSIKLNDISLPAPFMPCQVPPEMQADLDVTNVCVEWGRDLWKQKQTLRHPHFNPILLEGPASMRRQLLWKRQWWQHSSQRDIRLETWVFCFYMNQQASSNRWEMTRKFLIMNGSFSPLWIHLIFWRAIFVLWSTMSGVIFQSKSWTELHPHTHQMAHQSAINDW